MIFNLCFICFGTLEDNIYLEISVFISFDFSNIFIDGIVVFTLIEELTVIVLLFLFLLILLFTLKFTLL